jgi:hypothetical protein
MRRLLAASVCALALLMVPSGAHAANQTFYVNQSDPDANDIKIINNVVYPNLCHNPDVPCRTIVWAEGFADESDGNSVRVLPDPSSATDVYTGNVEVGHGGSQKHAVTLVGAGAGAGGTRIVGANTSPPQALRLVDDSHASDLSISQPYSFGYAIVDAGAGLVERVATEAPQGGAYSSTQGTVVDSTLNGRDGSAVGGVAARDIFIGQLLGVDAGFGLTPTHILNSLVVSSAGDPTGVGVRVQTSGSSVAADLRGVTVVAWNTRLLVYSPPLSATVKVANSTFAGGAATTDIRLNGPQASLALDHVNRSPARTKFENGAASAQLTDSSPLDVDPGLVSDHDGHLMPASALIDRGTSAGVLAGDSLDALDVDRQARTAGAAPDVGADELAPAGAPPGTPAAALGSDPPPVATGLRVSPSTFRLGSRLPRLARRRAVPSHTTIRFNLSEAAGVKITFAKRLPGRRVGKRCLRPSRALRRHRRCTRLVTVRGAALSVNARAGLNRLVFAGRLSARRRLVPARYRLTLVATDTAGHPSNTLKANFRLLPALPRRR